MEFDRTNFFNDYKGRFGTITNNQIVQGLEFLLGEIEKDVQFTILRQIAYVLATVKGETGIFQPIKEKRASQIKQPKLWATQNKYWNTGFMGRGYIQITWRDNYLKAGQKLTGVTVNNITIGKDTFVNNPDLVMQPKFAYLIISRGMREGWFTTKKLGDYIKEGSPPNYVGARYIVNGQDRAQEFASFAEKFELILRASKKP